MALNPIVFTEKVVRSFLRYQTRSGSEHLRMMNMQDQNTKTCLKAYKFRLKPSSEQSVQMAQIAGVCRLVWNICLKQREQMYSSRRKPVFAVPQMKELTMLRDEYAWIAAVPAQALQQKVRDLDVAYKNFFAKRAAFPESKNKGKSIDSFRYPQGFKIDTRLRLGRVPQASQVQGGLERGDRRGS